MSKPAEPSGRLSRIAPYIGQFRDLLQVIALTPGFVLLPVEIPGPDLALALAEWLTGQGHPAMVIEPRDDDVAWERLAASLLQATPGPNGVVLVIGSRNPPRSVFRGLQILNQRRDTIVAHLQCPLLWCGPQSFLDLTWKQAPDFWSIRAVDRRLEPETVVPQSAGAPENTKAAWESKKQLWEAARSQGDKHNAAQLAVGLVDALIDARKVDEAEAVIARQLSDDGEGQNPELWLRPARSAQPPTRSFTTDVPSLELWLRLAEITARRGNPVAAAKILGVLLSRSADSDSHLQLRARLAFAGLCAEAGDLVSAERAYREAHSDAHALGDREGEARALIGLGTIASRAGMPAEQSISHLEKAREIAKQLGDSNLEAAALAASAEVAALTHDERKSHELLAEARRKELPKHTDDETYMLAHELADARAERALSEQGPPAVADTASTGSTAQDHSVVRQMQRFLAPGYVIGLLAALLVTSLTVVTMLITRPFVVGPNAPVELDNPPGFRGAQQTQGVEQNDSPPLCPDPDYLEAIVKRYDCDEKAKADKKASSDKLLCLEWLHAPFSFKATLGGASATVKIHEVEAWKCLPKIGLKFPSEKDLSGKEMTELQNALRNALSGRSAKP